MPVITSVASMFASNRASAVAPALSSNYVRYSSSGVILNDGISAGTTGKQYDFDASGNSYIASFTPNDYFFNINKFLSDQTLSIVKQVALGNILLKIKTVTVLCNGTDVYAAIEYTTLIESTSYNTVMKFDSSLSLIWDRSFTVSGNYVDAIALLKHPSLDYIYYSMGSRLMAVIDSTSGSLTVTYDTVDWHLLTNENSYFTNNNLYYNSDSERIIAGNGGTYINLDTGSYTVSSVSQRTITTSGISFTDKMYSPYDGFTYASYANTDTNETGIVKWNSLGGFTFNNKISISGVSIPVVMSLTLNDTYIYAFVTDGVVSTTLHVLRFDMDLTYVDGFVLTAGAGSSVPQWAPLLHDTKLSSCYEDTLWCLPSDMSTPGSGTYVVNGVTFTKTVFSGTVTVTANSISKTTTTPTVSTMTPSAYSASLSVTDTTNPLTFVGL